jgi:hypothetical protein
MAINQMKSFNDFLECCKNEVNYNGQNVKDSFESNWSPLLKEFRTNKKLPNLPGYRHIVLNGLFDYSLSDEEAFFILSHTGSSSSWVNNSLRNGRQFDTLCQQYFAEGLSNALNKLPSYSNKQVYRMDEPTTDNIEDVFSWFERNQGEIVRTPYFLSTSKENWKSTLITWSIKTLPANSNAKDLSLITNNDTETEVLFNCNSYFKILGINSAEKLIEIVEVPESRKAIDLTGFYFE